jgi:hypothetical protein
VETLGHCRRSLDLSRSRFPDLRSRRQGRDPLDKPTPGRQVGHLKNVQALEKDIRTWTAHWNDDPRPFVWTKTADEILNSLADYLAKLAPDTKTS